MPKLVFMVWIDPVFKENCRRFKAAVMAGAHQGGELLAVKLRHIGTGTDQHFHGASPVAPIQKSQVGNGLVKGWRVIKSANNIDSCAFFQKELE